MKQKFGKITKVSLLFNTLLFITFSCLVSVVTVRSSAEASLPNISKSYSSTEAIELGSLVSISDASNSEIVLANSTNDNYLIGVAIASEDSLVAINPNSNKIQVAIGGEASVLVSNLAGDIKNGDLIAQSVISGIGAKALEGDRVIGVAQEDFDITNKNIKQQTVIDKNNKQVQISIGVIKVLIAAGSATTKADQTSSIERLAARIVGKPVSLVRLIVCGVIGLVGLVALIVMAYSSIRSYIIATGRNPLAKPTIFASLAQVMSMTALVSVICLISMYLVAKI